MKERPVDLERSVVTHYQTAEISQPSEGALDRPAPFVARQDSPVLRRHMAAVLAVRRDQQDRALHDL